MKGTHPLEVLRFAKGEPVSGALSCLIRSYPCESGKAKRVCSFRSQVFRFVAEKSRNQSIVASPVPITPYLVVAK